MLNWAEPAPALARACDACRLPTPFPVAFSNLVAGEADGLGWLAASAIPETAWNCDDKDRCGVDSSQKWYLVNAEGQIVGRLATRIATLLRGKHKTAFAPHLDIGDHVVVVNAEKVRFTADKWNTKFYHRHSGYPGGLKSEDAAKVRREHPERILVTAVSGMLPKNKLRKRMLGRLKVYAGPSHPHGAQQPQSISW